MIVGHKNIILCLQKAMECNRLHHFYIFSGPNGVGKTKIAEWFAEKLLKTPAEKLRINPDFLKIEQNAIAKEDIDMAINWLSLSPFNGFAKLLIINNAHEMSGAAANAFLKTLEEPAKKATIILITPEPAKLLATIVSRSAFLNFRPVGKDEILQFLTKEHHIEDAKKFVSLSCGKPGRAIELAKNPEKFNQITAGIKEFSELFFGECGNRFSISGKLAALKDEGAKGEISQKINFWIEIVRDILLLKYNLRDGLAYLKDIDILEKMSQKKSAGYFAELGKKLIKMKHLLSNNINIKLMLENLII